jgi:hypothetical protein
MLSPLLLCVLPSLKLLLVAQSHHQGLPAPVQVACPSPHPKTPVPTRLLLRVTGPYDSDELRQYSVFRPDGPYSDFALCMSVG